MNHPVEITNFDDVIDLRDVEARIGYLAIDEDDPEQDPDEKAELSRLRALVEECPSSSGVLIRDSYFADYAEQFADDLGLIADASKWPFCCIDWERAADQLKADFHDVDFDGVEYWFEDR